MIQLGRGKVNFPAVFAALRDAGFYRPHLPRMRRWQKPTTSSPAPPRPTAQFLEKTIAAV